MTADLHALADWLDECGVDVVALESTGVHWIPLCEVLKQRGLQVWLVDARQVKYVPGRKSDVQDCQWLQKLLSLGLLRAAFRPPAEVCVIRAVSRQREVLLTQQASWVQRMRKALVQMIVLGQALGMYDDLGRHLRECDAKLRELLAARGGQEVEVGQEPRAGTKAHTDFDRRKLLANWAGVDLTRINGLGLDSVLKILSEIGVDLRRFANVKHFCSWLGLCPATKISGGKVLSAGTKRSANRARQALKMAAMTLAHSDSALGAFYRRLCSRMDKPRANTATAHKLARLVYFMLTRGEAFVDQGQQRYEEQQRPRSIAALKRRAGRPLAARPA